jgi:lysophospholipase L1-like esterase
MKKTDTFGAHVVGTLINYFGKIMYTFGTVLNSLFEQRKPPSQAKFLFLGDSNTYDSTNNWTGYLIRDLGIRNAKIIQKNGGTTTWMKDQLAQELARGNKYDYIFIWGGVNDIYSTGTQRGKNTAIQNIKDMIMMLRKAKDTEGKTPKIVVINMACDKLREDSVRYPTPEKLASEFYRELMNITFAQVVPTREVLKIGKVPCQSLSQKDLLSLRKTLCRDNLCHLNPSANKVLADYIQKNVFKL